MAHRKCFNGVADDLNSGQYISRKKAKTIYKASVDLAKQPIPGVYQKKTSTGQKKGIYVGDINISRGETPASGAAPQQSGCLIGATSYASLSSVTEGKYLVDPINFDIRRTQDMWVGSIYAMDMSGATTLIPYPGASPPYNTFLYPPSSDSNQIYPNYPDPSNNNIGPVVDPCYNIFYPIGVEQSSRGTCYLKNERAYKQYLKCLPYTTEQAKVYAKAQNGYIGDIFYPKKFHFGCDQLWINDISHCLTAELGGRNNRNSSGSGSTVGSTPTITRVTMSWGSVINAEAVESPVYVGVTTSGVEDGQLVTVTLNSKDYTEPISENRATVTITATNLQALPNDSYTITVNVSNTDGIPAATFTSDSFEVDTVLPIINAIETSAFSWGDVLNSVEDNANGTVTVTTSGVEDGQAVSITLNGQTYTANVYSDSATVTITAAGLQDLTNDSSYTMTANVSDAAGNAATQVTSSSFSVDTTAPVLAEVTPIVTPSNNTTPTYVFSSTQAGTMSYTGSSNFSPPNAVVGENSITFNTLVDGTYSNIKIFVTDDLGNVSNGLTIPTFVIDTTKPVLTQVTEIVTPSNNTTPTYVFSSTQAGTMSYTGSSNFSPPNAVVGENSITFNTLVDGTYSNIKIFVTDDLGNVSNGLTIPTFVIDTTKPVLTQVTPIETPSNNDYAHLCI